MPKPVKMTQPNVPQFDRGIKPNTFSDLNQNIQRDFAPVYGCPVSFYFFDKNSIKINRKLKNVCKRDSNTILQHIEGRMNFNLIRNAKNKIFTL